MAPRNGGVTKDAVTNARTTRLSGMSLRATGQARRGPRRGAAGPDRLADEPGPERAVAVGEPADGRDDPGWITAEHGHVGERHHLARLAQNAADQV